MYSEHSQDSRLVQLNSWLDAVLPAHDALEPASSDASFRRYFRVFSGAKSWIVMDAPPTQEDCRPFVRVCKELATQGLRVPIIQAQNLDLGFLLLDDLGDTTLLGAMNAQRAESAYQRAIDSLVCLQGAPAQNLPVYDEALLRREMALFHDWYLDVHRQRRLSDQEHTQWAALCDALVANALSQPRCFVHRDYHSRNLMWHPEQALGVLDFQDAVYGPVTYDLVSLLRDCYVSWPPERLAAWMAYYQEQAAAAGLTLPPSAEFQRAFDWMGVQRHLKAVGIFARLNHRDGKANYLNDIPRTLTYLHEVSAQYPALAFLNELVAECLD
jgi:aminoglycoside/choline kinase family phosphotransferase